VEGSGFTWFGRLQYAMVGEKQFLGSTIDDEALPSVRPSWRQIFGKKKYFNTLE
jgi:hypothetical protein